MTSIHYATAGGVIAFAGIFLSVLDWRLGVATAVISIGLFVIGFRKAFREDNETGS